MSVDGAHADSSSCLEAARKKQSRSVHIAAGDAAEEINDDDGSFKVSPCAKRQRMCDDSATQVRTGGTDEEFSEWVGRTLRETASGATQLEVPAIFKNFTFTGGLRPAHVTPKMKAPEGSALPDYATHPRGLCRSERLADKKKEIPVLTAEELEIMREACRLGREVLDIASRFVRVGVSGDEIDRVVWQACADRKLYPSPLNYYSFPKSVCVSVNEVICHGVPNCRPLEEGDTVNLDVTVHHRGFHSDLNETFFIGKCSEESHQVVRVAYEALQAAALMIRPGTFYRDLGAAIQAKAAKEGCAVVPGFAGHGIGRLFHGHPTIPHYKRNKARGVMKPGHVFTVEPMLNLGKSGGHTEWPDDWTAVTKDGKLSATFEHTFLVTEEGVEVMTARLGMDRSSMVAYDPMLFQR